MPEVKRPKKGSRAFWPKKRAKRIYPAVQSWLKTGDVKPLGFAGYKAGMTHIGIVDSNPNSRYKGQVMTKSVTVIDCPPLKIIGFCGRSSYPSRVLCSVFSDKVDKNLKRKMTVGKINTDEQLKKLEQVKDKIVKVCLIVSTQPSFKKTPEIFELPIGGEVGKQIEYAKEKLGSTLPISDIFKEGDFIDVSSVSKGKGFQGTVKRFGTKLQSRKTEQCHRIVGCIGQKEPGKVRSTIPRPGQLGFQTRTEFNKKIVKIHEKVIIDGGFINFGNASENAILLEGSVPGSKKRLIRLRGAIRANKQLPVDVRYISTSSKQGV
jgi:large subunit ribosomal protein L3